MEPELIERILVILGTPLERERVLNPDDVEALRHCARVLAAGFPLVAFLQLVRVYVQSLRRIADAEVRLTHLYVHEPMIRDGVPELEMAEEIGSLAADVLPLSTPLTEYLHTRYLRFFLEQDVVGHMESELGTEVSELGQVPIALCFIDLTGFTRYTEEEGDREALDVIETFVATVEATLPPEATIVKTIGDEVMVVSPDAGLADRVGGRDPRPLPAAAPAAGRDPLGRSRLPRRRLLRHPRQPRPPCRQPRPRRRAARHRRRRRGDRGPRAAPRRSDRRGHPEGIPGADRALRDQSRPRGMSMVEQVRDAGLLPAGQAARRDALRGPRLGLPARPRRPPAGPGGGDRPARQLRAAAEGADADEAHCATLCAGLGVRLEVERPRRPEGAGNLQSWARDTRYAAAAGLAESAGRADRHRPHRRRPGRDDPLPAGLLAQPPGAARDARPRRQAGAAAARLHPRADHRLLRGARAWPGATTRATSSRPTPATGSATGSCRRSPRSTRRPPATSCARRSCCATRPRSSTPSSTTSSTAPARRPRGEIALERLVELPPALRRLVVQRLADRAAGRPVAGAARHADQVASLRPTGRSMLDLGSGVRAVVERGVVRAERD